MTNVGFNTTTMKKAYELSFGKFFIDRLNQKYHLNYHVISNTQEENDVDIYAISDKNRVLNFQLKTGEPELERFWGERKKRGSGMVVIDENIESGLLYIINSGEKHYSDKENLILLITGRLLFDCDPTFALYLSNKLNDTAFMGVYLVRFNANFNITLPKEDYVVAIKDIFGNHGKMF